MPLSTGQVLKDRYRIVKLLGQGGFGAVYRAWDLNMECPRAVKENLDTSPEAQRQFRREAMLLGELIHPNLPRVIDHFIIPNQGQYLVMDYIEGEDLGAMLGKDKSPLEPVQALAWVLQILSALEYLHSQEPAVIHRDIKPANIKITPDGKAMLVDFGIAKQYDPSLRTTMGARAVTPGYSPPEQYGTGTTDARSDIYSMGATIYTLLTNKEPPASVDLVSGVAPPLRLIHEIYPEIPPGVSGAVARAMNVNRDGRFASMAEFRLALEQAAGRKGPEPVAATQIQPAVQAVPYSPTLPLSGQPIAPKPARRWVMLGAGIAAGVLLVVVGILGWPRLFSTTAEKPEPTQAASWLLTSSPNTNLGEEGTQTQTEAVTTEQPVSVNETATASPAPERAWPTFLPGQIRDEFGVPMIKVPPGTFRMGSDNGAEAEKPAHSITLDGFYIDQFEVTNIDYKKCVTDGVCEVPARTNSMTRINYYDHPDYAYYPVINVSWNMADTFCRWRGVRLPTEAEWERAARGGLEGKDYPWGDETPSCTWGAINGANYKECGWGDTVAVGSYAANGWGLFDMAGNVWEWVSDFFRTDFYKQSPRLNPSGPTDGTTHVHRGGSYNSFTPSILVFTRMIDIDLRTGGSILSIGDEYKVDYGFRCASSSAP